MRGGRGGEEMEYLLEPDRLPDAAGGCVEDRGGVAGGMESLLAHRYVRKLRGIRDPQQQLVGALASRCQRGGYVDGKLVIPGTKRGAPRKIKQGCTG